MQTTYFVADCETIPASQAQYEGSARIWLTGYQRLDDDKLYWYQTWDEFFEKLSTERQKDGHQLKHITLYFHNAVFDFSYIKEWLFNDKGYQASDLDEIIVDGNLYQAQFKYINKAGKETYFKIWDSLKLLTKGVERLQANENIKAQTRLDYEKWRLYKNRIDFMTSPEFKNDMTYFRNDIETVRKKLLEFLLNNHHLTMTIGVATFKNLKAYLFSKYGSEWVKEKFDCLSKIEFDCYNDWYRGGLVLLNPKYQGIEINQVGCSIDINSTYPHVMTDYLPIGHQVNEQYSDIKYCHYYTIKLYTVHLKPNHIPYFQYQFWPNKGEPYLHCDFNNPQDMVNHEKHQIVHLIDIEWEMILLNYEIEYEILEDHVFEMTKWAKDWILSLYDRKMNATNEADKDLAKLFMNSAYGKLGQNYLRSSQKYFTLEEIVADEKLSGINAASFAWGGKWYLKDVWEESEYIPYIIAACYITAAARVNLMKAINNNHDTFVYCDTDSLKLLTTQPRGVIIDSKALGTWKYEFTFQSAYFAKKKQYLQIINRQPKLKCGGLHSQSIKKIENMSPEEAKSIFKIGNVIKRGKLEHKMFKGGMLLIPYDFQITEEYYESWQ